MQTQFKIVIEKHTDGYIAYPLGLKGIVIGQGDTYEEAFADIKSAIRFHIETFGTGSLGIPMVKCLFKNKYLRSFCCTAIRCI